MRLSGKEITKYWGKKNKTQNLKKKKKSMKLKAKSLVKINNTKTRNPKPAMPVILVPRTLKQEDPENEVSLGDPAMP